MGKSGKTDLFTKKGERLIKSIKKRNRSLPASKRVNPFAIATSRGFRRKKR